MTPLYIALASLALLLASLTLWVQLPTRNMALLLLCCACIGTQLVLLLGAILFPNRPSLPSPPQQGEGNNNNNTTTSFSASSPHASVFSPALHAMCDLQAFFLNVFGIAIYGSCLSLAIELSYRTRAATIIPSKAERSIFTVPRNWLYMGLALGLPSLLGAVDVAFRKSGPYFVKHAFCDNETEEIVFLIVFVLSLGFYTIFGSIFTVLSVFTYASRRSAIVKALQDSLSTAPSAVRLRSAAAQSAQQLLQTLQRMIVWSVGYHVLAIGFVVQTTTASAQKMIKGDERSTSDGMESRANTVQFATAGVSVLLFCCFGLGQNTLPRIRLLVPCLRRSVSPNLDPTEPGSTDERGRHRSLNMFRQGTVTEAELTSIHGLSRPASILPPPPTHPANPSDARTTSPPSIRTSLIDPLLSRASSLRRSRSREILLPGPTSDPPILWDTEPAAFLISTLARAGGGSGNLDPRASVATRNGSVSPLSLSRTASSPDAYPASPLFLTAQGAVADRRPSGAAASLTSPLYPPSEPVPVFDVARRREAGLGWCQGRMGRTANEGAEREGTGEPHVQRVPKAFNLGATQLPSALSTEDVTSSRMTASPLTITTSLHSPRERLSPDPRPLSMLPPVNDASKWAGFDGDACPTPTRTVMEGDAVVSGSGTRGYSPNLVKEGGVWKPIHPFPVCPPPIPLDDMQRRPVSGITTTTNASTHWWWDRANDSTALTTARPGHEALPPPLPMTSRQPTRTTLPRSLAPSLRRPPTAIVAGDSRRASVATMLDLDSAASTEPLSDLDVVHDTRFFAAGTIDRVTRDLDDWTGGPRTHSAASLQRLQVLRLGFYGGRAGWRGSGPGSPQGEVAVSPLSMETEDGQGGVELAMLQLRLPGHRMSPLPTPVDDPDGRRQGRRRWSVGPRSGNEDAGEMSTIPFSLPRRRLSVPTLAPGRNVVDDPRAPGQAHTTKPGSVPQVEPKRRGSTRTHTLPKLQIPFLKPAPDAAVLPAAGGTAVEAAEAHVTVHPLSRAEHHERGTAPGAGSTLAVGSGSTSEDSASAGGTTLFTTTRTPGGSGDMAFEWPPPMPEGVVERIKAEQQATAVKRYGVAGTGGGEEEVVGRGMGRCDAPLITWRKGDPLPYWAKALRGGA
ncbi:hypothetical protein HDU96_010360 [Phlyctochytrium bullatum]|nr:hypothetical protein HDU96_010360 [Phlyctochytrium bullatum]